MNAMKWLLGVAVAAAIVVPLQSAQAGGGGNDGGGRPAESDRVHYRGDGYYGVTGVTTGLTVITTDITATTDLTATTEVTGTTTEGTVTTSGRGFAIAGRS